MALGLVAGLTFKLSWNVRNRQLRRVLYGVPLAARGCLGTLLRDLHGARRRCRCLRLGGVT